MMNDIKIIRENIEQDPVEIKPTSRRDIRALAFHYVYAVDRSDNAVTVREVVQQFKKGFGVIIPTDSYAIRVAEGVTSQRVELDALICPYLRNWKLDRLGCCTLLILRIAFWELQQAEAISSVVINEAVELAKAFAEKDAYKFVNGILDQAKGKFISAEEGQENNGESITDVTEGNK